MDSCETHGWWEVNGQDQCPTCEIASLRAEVERLTSDLTLLVDKNEPEPYALHYDECPYKPFADLPRWDEPENLPVCTCSVAHKAAYWKARWMLTAGWRQITERERDEALTQVAVLYRAAQTTTEILCLQVDQEYLAPLACLDDLKNALKRIPESARALLDRLQRAESVVEAATHYMTRMVEDDEALLMKALASWEEGKT